jgi:hypothetical protein
VSAPNRSMKFRWRNRLGGVIKANLQVLPVNQMDLSGHGGMKGPTPRRPARVNC